MIVEMRRDAWHVRLQEWTFGEVDLRPSLCPYFWVTVFCVFIAAPLFLFRDVIARGFGWAADRFEKFLNDRWSASTKKTASELTAETAYFYHKIIASYDARWGYVGPDSYLYSYANRIGKMRDALHVWKEMNPEWEKIFEEQKRLEEEWQRWVEAQKTVVEKRVTRQLTRAQAMSRIARATRFIFNTIMVVMVFIFATIVGTGIRLFFIHFFDIPWLIVGGVVLCIAVVIGALWAIMVWMDRPSRYRHSEPGLIRLYLRAAKENYCPQIKWKD